MMKTIMKVYLLKAFNQGFDYGANIESQSSLGMDYTSNEQKEVERAEIIQELESRMVAELTNQLHRQARLHSELKPYYQDRTKFNAKFNSAIDEWFGTFIADMKKRADDESV